MTTPKATWKKGIAGTLGVALALCLGLTACGGGPAPAADGSGNGSTAAPAPAAPTGAQLIDTWTVTEMESSDSSIDAATMENARKGGMVAYMIVSADGTYELNLADDVTSGTWTATSENEATIDFEGETASIKAVGNTLVLSQGPASITMTRGDLDGVATSTSAPTASTTPALPVAANGSNPSISDELISMEIIYKGLDSSGDAIIRYNMTNNSNVRICVRDSSATIDGKSFDPIMITQLDPGESVTNDFLFFEQEETGFTSESQFKNVVIEVEVTNDSTNDVLGTYTITLQ